MPNLPSLRFPIATGLLAGSLFVLMAAIGLGFVFLFLPTLPLFYLGLGKNSEKLSIAIGVASMIIALSMGLPMGLLFLIFLGFPVSYVSKHSLRRRVQGTQVQWLPVGNIIISLMLYGCGLVAFIALYYMSQDTSLPKILSANIHTAFADLGDDYSDVIETLSGELSFLTFPVTLWLWAILLYGHAWLANRLLTRRGASLRPDFSVQIFTIPGWMLSLLGICALASLIGSESVSFLGKSTILSLMLPYFFLGISLMHNACKALPSRRILLFFVYFMIVSQFWPALILAAVGLWHQVKSMGMHPHKTP